MNTKVMAILIIVKFTDDVELKKTVLESSGSCSVPPLILFRKQLKRNKSIYEYFNNKHISKPIKYELLSFQNMFNFHYIKQEDQKHFQKKYQKHSFLWNFSAAQEILFMTSQLLLHTFVVRLNFKHKNSNIFTIFRIFFVLYSIIVFPMIISNLEWNNLYEPI